MIKILPSFRECCYIVQRAQGRGNSRRKLWFFFNVNYNNVIDEDLFLTFRFHTNCNSFSKRQFKILPDYETGSIITFDGSNNIRWKKYNCIFQIPPNISKLIWKLDWLFFEYPSIKEFYWYNLSLRPFLIDLPSYETTKHLTCLVSFLDKHKTNIITDLSAHENHFTHKNNVLSFYRTKWYKIKTFF